MGWDASMYATCKTQTVHSKRTICIQRFRSKSGRACASGVFQSGSRSSSKATLGVDNYCFCRCFAWTIRPQPKAARRCWPLEEGTASSTSTTLAATSSARAARNTSSFEIRCYDVRQRSMSVHSRTTVQFETEIRTRLRIVAAVRTLAGWWVPGYLATRPDGTT